MAAWLSACCMCGALSHESSRILRAGCETDNDGDRGGYREQQAEQGPE